MKKKRIGIPRALNYHRNGILLKYYFSLLGCKVIISPETNREILNLGINNTIDECCLSYKIYIGHAIYLSKTCDYILTTRICDYGKKNKACTRFNGTYDNLKVILPKEQLLQYNIEHTKHIYETLELIKLGFKFSKNPLKIIYSYLLAKYKQKNHDINKENEQKNKLLKPNQKILILSHYYNIEDKFISNYIKEYLTNHDIIPIYSHYLNRKIAANYSKYFSNTLYWITSKEIIGSLYYYKNQVSGIIFISTYPCGIDSLVNNLAIYKNKDIPIINIIIDENITELNLETKLESFLDIIKGAHHE